MKLNKEEKEILKSYEKGEWKSVPKSKSEIKRYRTYAETTLRKDRRVNIRLSSRDLEGIQRLAVQEGLPYQTFLASIIHKYVSGRLRPTEHRG